MGCSDSPAPIPLRSVRHVARWYRRSRGGDDGVSQVPGGPLRSCPAHRPRWNPRTLTMRTTLSRGVAVCWRLSPRASASILPRSLSRRLAARGCCLPPYLRRRLPRSLLLSGLNHTACPLAVYASRLSFPVARSYGHARLACQLGVILCCTGLSPARVPCEVSALVTSLSPHPGFAWRTGNPNRFRPASQRFWSHNCR